MKIVTLLLLLVSTAFGGEKGIERKVRKFLLVDDKLAIAEMEYLEVKGYANEDWVDYVYFSFTTTHSLEEVVPMSRVLAGSEVSPLLFRDALDDFPLIPKVSQGVAGQKRPTIVATWYRAPHVYSGWVIGVKCNENQTKIFGLIESRGLPTNGTFPKKLFDRAGNAMGIDKLLDSNNITADEEGEQDGADQPATAVESKAEVEEKPKTESEGRSQ